TIKDIRSFVKAVRERPYDLVIDFHGLLKSAVIVFLSSGRRKLGYNSMQEMSGLFLNEKIPEDMGKHAVLRYLDFPRYLGAETGEPEFLIPIRQENGEKMEELLKTNHIDIKDDFVVVNPIAFWETKLWEEEKFARLCDLITEELKVKVIFTGSKFEEIRRLQSLMTLPSINLGGGTTLRDLAYLYRLAALLVTTDSGPMHLAAAMGTPVVALFGPTDPSLTGPFGQGHTVMRKGLPCSPCFLKKCDTKRCMHEITVEDVLHEVKEKFLAYRKEKVN
ncbi:MAG: glycosyltransferase family 9 protein, partial [Syntrophales bacterium]|nr:glycosyltransferase family 9 protein [Syntrophales bacterium]